MIFYVGVVFFTTLFAYIYDHTKAEQKKLMFILLVLFPTFFEGMRGCGTDYGLYINHYDEIVAGRYELTDYKSLFVWIVIGLSKIGIGFQVVIFITSFTTIYLVFYIFKKYEKDINFTVAVFSFMLIFYQMSFNTYRQILAAVIFLYATVNLYKDNRKRVFWMAYVIAVAIHSSILPFGLLYFMRRWITDEKYKKVRVVFYLVTISLVFVLPVIANFIKGAIKFAPHYAWYLTTFKRSSIGFGILRYLIMGVFPIVYIGCKNLFFDLKDKGIDFLPFYTIFGMIIWLTSYVSESSIYRMSYNMLICLPILHGYLIKKKMKRSMCVLTVLIILIMILFWIYDGIVINTGETVPYAFFWQK